MTIRVRVTTGDFPAAVLSYPRDGDPVHGAEWTEVARVPANSEQEFTVGASMDLLVAELPEAQAPAEVQPQKEAASLSPTASLHEAA